MHFVDRLFAAMRRVGNPVVVGIDPRPEELAAGFLERFPGERETAFAEALAALRLRCDRRRRSAGRRGQVSVRIL